MGCSKPVRALSRSWSSGGALRLLSFRSSSSSRGDAGTRCSEGEIVRRRSRVSMLRRESSRESAEQLNARRFDSVSSVGEVVFVRGTTVVMICSLGGAQSVGESGGRQGLGERMTRGAGCASGAGERTGKRRRPTSWGSPRRALEATKASTSLATGAAAWTGVRRLDCRKEGSLGEREPSLLALVACELKRAVIWSSEGKGLRLLRTGAVLGTGERIGLPSRRKSTCSTHGWPTISLGERFSNTPMGDSMPGDGRE